MRLSGIAPAVIPVIVENSIRPPGSSIQGVAGGGADRLAHWDGRSDFPPAQPAESVTQRPFPESREPAHAGGICGLSCAGRSAPAAGSFGRDVATAGQRVK